MHCYCCDQLLDDVDATARFAESGNFVEMCKKCRQHLPKDIKIITRSDFERKDAEGEDSDNDKFDLEDYDGEKESW